VGKEREGTRVQLNYVSIKGNLCAIKCNSSTCVCPELSEVLNGMGLITTKYNYIPQIFFLNQQVTQNKTKYLIWVQ